MSRISVIVGGDAESTTTGVSNAVCMVITPLASADVGIVRLTNAAPPAGAVVESPVGDPGSVKIPCVASLISTWKTLLTPMSTSTYVPEARLNGQSRMEDSVGDARL